MTASTRSGQWTHCAMNFGALSKVFRSLEGALATLDCTAECHGAFRDLWERPLPWKLAPEFGGGTVLAPAFLPNAVRWLRFAIDVSGASELESGLILIERQLERSPAIVEFPLEAGHLMIVDNRRALHARTPVNHADASNRLLLRTKVIRQDAASLSSPQRFHLKHDLRKH